MQALARMLHSDQQANSHGKIMVQTQLCTVSFCYVCALFFNVSGWLSMKCTITRFLGGLKIQLEKNLFLLCAKISYIWFSFMVIWAPYYCYIVFFTRSNKEIK